MLFFLSIPTGYRETLTHDEAVFGESGKQSMPVLPTLAQPSDKDPGIIIVPWDCSRIVHAEDATAVGVFQSACKRGVSAAVSLSLSLSSAAEGLTRVIVTVIAVRLLCIGSMLLGWTGIARRRVTSLRVVIGALASLDIARCASSGESFQVWLVRIDRWLGTMLV